MRIAVVAIALIALVGCACASRIEVHADVGSWQAHPGELVSPDELDVDFVARQHVVAIRDGRVAGSFEAVLEKTGDTLTLVALSPATGEAFVLEQRGVETRFETRVEIALPFPPEFILLDVNRAFFMGISDTALPDGEHTGGDGVEEVSELWEGGQLLERSFRRLDGVPAGVISVRFLGGCSPNAVPTELVLDNGWFGYRLEIRTLSIDYLESASSDGP